MNIERRIQKIEDLLEENNIMLRCICTYLIKQNSPRYRDEEDLKNFMTNLVADWYTDRIIK